MELLRKVFKKCFECVRGSLSRIGRGKILKEWTMLKHERVSASDLERNVAKSTQKQKETGRGVGGDLFLHV